MVKIRCKFFVEKAEPTWGEEKKITMRAQYDPNLKEDESFSKYTPAGQIEILVSSPLALETLTPGQYVYVDFTPMEQQAAAE